MLVRVLLVRVRYPPRPLRLDDLHPLVSAWVVVHHQVRHQRVLVESGIPGQEQVVAALFVAYYPVCRPYCRITQ